MVVFVDSDILNEFDNSFKESSLLVLANFIEGEICKVLQVGDELQKLQETLERIGGFLESAERKRLTDSDIGRWVRELKDVMYDADDIIDLCIVKGERLLEGQPLASAISFSFASPCSYFRCVKLRHQISSKIQGLNSRLKQIKEDRSILPRLEQVPQEHRASSRETSFLEVKTDVVGTRVEDDARNLIKLILENDKQKYRVFGIVGMGGIGKTTLARKIYNDEWIKENFPIRIWLYVSNNYSENQLLKEVIRCAGGDTDGFESAATLQTRVVSLLSTNSLIVLDDVWCSDVWENLLRKPVMNGEGSSKIVVTTRDAGIARSMNACIHHVEQMDEESGWELLRKMALGDGTEDEISTLKEIGVEIVKRCDGLPLAIKVIAGVLRKAEASKEAWEAVLRSDSWHMNQIDKEELPAALHLSYADLPSHLKPCFLYCSLYIPYSISCHDLARAWVAEGFIGADDGERLMEDIAEDYYWELISRNLLQPDPRSMDGDRCTMHDLLRSLAHFLMEGEGILFNDGARLHTSPLTKVRRLSMVNIGERLQLPEVILKQNCLRTLILHESPKTRMVNDVLVRLEHLRVLDVSDSCIEGLPDSIGKLLHLRYLDLDRTNIRRIPESIGSLANLQTLNIAECKCLDQLPKSIMMLRSLRCLRLKRTPLTHLPKGISKLENLIALGGLIIGCGEYATGPDEGCQLEELRSLSKLRYVRIHNLERAVEGGGEVLANKPFLKRLLLSWDNQAPVWQEQMQRAEVTCDSLCPPPSLRELNIKEFPYQRFPIWFRSASVDASFPNLSYLMLSHFPSCAELPPLGRLPKLKFLSIREADAVVAIGPEILGHIPPGAAAFPKLEVMQFVDMRNWEQWSSCMTEEDSHGERLQLLPNLQKCYLIDCPKLAAVPGGLRRATRLKLLKIRSNHRLTEIMNLAFLDELHVNSNQGLQRISDLPSLRYLAISDCPQMVCVENLDSLQHLVLECSPSTVHLPRWLPLLMEQHRSEGASFKKFELQCSLPLLESCRRNEANWDVVQQIPDVRIRTKDGSRFIWYTKDPQLYSTNAGLA
nr:PREDICTED: putative disease resistance protein RGA3 [Musa acuminata subsp. malaccensis]